MSLCVQASAGAVVRGPGQPAVLVDVRQGLVAQLHQRRLLLQDHLQGAATPPATLPNPTVDPA